MIIVKLGGSVITRKAKPLTINRKAIAQVAVTLRESRLPLVIVHGAGSFGHYNAKRFRIKSRSRIRDAEGITRTRDSMSDLNLSLTRILLESGLYLYSFPPIALYREGKLDANAGSMIREIIKVNLIPITYGDIMLGQDGFKILSGDAIVRDLALLLKPKRIIFASDVDGISEKPGKNSPILPELDQSMIPRLSFSKVNNDVTGGMENKVLEAMRIAGQGIDVFFTNGLRRARLMKALKGEKEGGTRIRGFDNEN